MKKLFKTIFIPVALVGMILSTNVSLFAHKKASENTQEQQCRHKKCHFKIWCSKCREAAEENDYTKLERLIKHKEAHIKHWKKCLSKNEEFLKKFKAAVSSKNDDKIMDLINEHEETIEKMKAEHRKMCTEMCKKGKTEKYMHKKTSRYSEE